MLTSSAGRYASRATIAGARVLVLYFASACSVLPGATVTTAPARTGPERLEPLAAREAFPPIRKLLNEPENSGFHRRDAFPWLVKYVPRF